MTQSGVSAFARLARRFALSAVLLFASAGALAAQTGKLEGKVRDQAGAPIQSAQVFIVGTAFSALTNAQGYYFINNIPAGTVAVRGRLHRLQEDRNRGREDPRRTDDHAGHPARAGHGRPRLPRWSSRRPTRWCPATKSRPSSASTVSSPRTCRWTGWARCCSCSRASSARTHRDATSRSVVAETDEAAFYVDGVIDPAGQPRQRRRGGRLPASPSNAESRTRRRPERSASLWLQRLRGSVDHDRRGVGAVRQCPVRHRQPHVAYRRHQDRRPPRGRMRRDVRVHDRHGVTTVLKGNLSGPISRG